MIGSTLARCNTSLLGRYADIPVREYAVACLESLSDGELDLYMPQLIQVSAALDPGGATILNSNALIHPAHPDPQVRPVPPLGSQRLPDAPGAQVAVVRRTPPNPKHSCCLFPVPVLHLSRIAGQIAIESERLRFALGPCGICSASLAIESEWWHVAVRRCGARCRYIGHLFFWYLKAELHVIEISERYSLLVEEFLGGPPSNCPRLRAGTRGCFCANAVVGLCTKGAAAVQPP